MENFDINREKALVVIDAMRGFTSKGTFGEAFGEEDSMPIDETFGRIQEFLDRNSNLFGTRCLVRSVYEPGKFVKDENSPLYHLCIKGSKDLEDAIHINGEWFTVQKAENDATTESGFTNWVKKSIIESGKNGVLATGCTLTTCVKETLMSMRRILNDANKEGTDIIALLNLIGSRKSHGNKGTNGKSRIDLVTEEMRDNGIKVINSL